MTFEELYIQARDIYNNDENSIRPIDPVIRYLENKTWILESRLTPPDDYIFEIGLDVFESYFYDAFEDADYLPTNHDENSFIDAININMPYENDN